MAQKYSLFPLDQTINEVPDSQLSVMRWEREKERQSFLCFLRSCRVWIFPLQLLRRNWGNVPRSYRGPRGQPAKGSVCSSQRIPKYPPKYTSTSSRRIPEKHPTDPCASSQNPRISPKGPVSIPQRIPEYFPKRSVTSAAERRVGPGFPPGSGRSSPSSVAGIPHPLWTQGPDQRQHPAPWGEDSGEHPSIHVLGCREPQGIPGFTPT